MPRSARSSMAPCRPRPQRLPKRASEERKRHTNRWTSNRSCRPSTTDLVRRCRWFRRRNHVRLSRRSIKFSSRLHSRSTLPSRGCALCSIMSRLPRNNVKGRPEVHDRRRPPQIRTQKRLTYSLDPCEVIFHKRSNDRPCLRSPMLVPRRSIWQRPSDQILVPFRARIARDKSTAACAFHRVARPPYSPARRDLTPESAQRGVR